MEVNKNIIEALKNSKRVAIFIHINPDGDCLGSASALKEALVSLNKTVDIFSDSLVPENYLFIKHLNEVKHDDKVEGYDLLVAVDCPDAKRVGKYAKYFATHENTICIDHHKSRENYTKLTHVEIVSSAALMIYYYVKELTELNVHMAEAIYAGISSDTGCFIHSNTTSEEHAVCAKLIDLGFDLTRANDMLFKFTPLSKFELTKRAYTNAEFFADGKIGMFKFTKKDLSETGADISDTTGLVNQITNVNGCEIGIMMYEQENGLFRCSLRSSGKIDVALIAEQFGGGGHMFASGCNVFGCLNTAKKKIVAACIKEVKKLG